MADNCAVHPREGVLRNSKPYTWKGGGPTGRSCRVPIRFVVAAICSFGCTVVYVTRVSMSIALVCMVNQTAVADTARRLHGSGSISTTTTDDATCPRYVTGNRTDDNEGSAISEDGPFVWDEEMQGIILSSFFWGYIVTQIPSGILADKIGGKWIWGVCHVTTSVLTMFLPLVARTDVNLVIGLRVLCGLAQGVTFPALATIMANWFPHQERSILINVATIGCSIGSMMTFPIGAFLCKSQFGWPFIFYLFGGMGLVWFCLWALFVTNKPSEHPWISTEEKLYIEMNTQCNHNRNCTAIPWKSLMTSPPFLVLCFCSFCGGFKFFMLLTQLPTYIKVVLQFDLAANGLINVMPYLVSMPVATLASVASDSILKTGRFKRTTIRKAFTLIGSGFSAAGLIAVPLAGCNRPFVLALIWSSMAVDAFNAGGIETNTVDMAPNMAGTISGISNSFAAAGGIVAPYVVGILTKNNNAKQGWNESFFISATIALTGLSAFLIFGSAETQPWNKRNVVDDNADTGRLLEANGRQEIVDRIKLNGSV